jgi:catechol 2,3-dioxygenase-like lactoylglutathione lyase family enzyme
MPSPLNYDGGLTLSFQVADMDKAIRWYQEKLGFNLLYRLDDMGWCELATETKGVNVGLSQVEKPKTGAGPVPTFGVNDIAAARTMLEKQDVRFDGDTIEIPNMVKLASFFDPDGNALMLYQSLQQR